MITEHPADELKAEAKQILNSLLKIPEGYSNEAADRFVDCVVATAALEVIGVLSLAVEERQGKHAGHGDAT